MGEHDANGDGTASPAYTQRLSRLAGGRWKRVLNVQAPYRWNLRRQLGDRRTLDVGCGIGRNLAHLPEGSVGVDHNADSVRVCLEAGLEAYTVDQFLAIDRSTAGQFDGMLAAHLVEHLPAGLAHIVLEPYLSYLTPNARVVLICPQERGYTSDPTHTIFTDQSMLAELAGRLELDLCTQHSFPLPRAAGRLFTYNEFVTVAATRAP